MTLPLAGHPCVAGRDKSQSKGKMDLIESAYRFLLADLMPFGRHAVITFEHGVANLSMEHYETVKYWYGLPAPSLIKTDEIDVGNLVSEKDHNYISPGSSSVESISSSYELSVDVFPDNKRYLDVILGYKDLSGKEIYHSHIEDGQYTRGISEFTIKLKPDNKGVMLRQTLDYSFPNQTAEVFIADIDSGQKDDSTKWVSVGIWYLAGSNTSLWQNFEGELAPRKLDIRTSNRLFREDEFLIPAELTKNSSAIKVKIKFIPDSQQHLLSTPFPKESACSELKYQVYCYQIPAFPSVK
ncbi:MAG: hypothetical protein ABSF81_17735 [Bacteroidales bacterium]